MDVYSQQGLLPSLYSENSNQRWVALNPQDVVSVRVQNRCAQEFQVALYADGVNAIDGQPYSASLKTVVHLGGYSTRVFQGWRTALDKEAQFEVAQSSSQSYRRLRGFGAAAGSFELAVFEKAPKTLYYVQPGLSKVPANPTGPVGTPSTNSPGSSVPSKGTVGQDSSTPLSTQPQSTYPPSSRPQYPKGRVAPDYGLPSSLKKVSELSFGRVRFAQAPSDDLTDKIAQGAVVYSSAQSAEFFSVSKAPAFVLTIRYGLALGLQEAGIVYSTPPLVPTPSFNPAP